MCLRHLTGRKLRSAVQSVPEAEREPLIFKKRPEAAFSSVTYVSVMTSTSPLLSEEEGRSISVLIIQQVIALLLHA